MHLSPKTFETNKHNIKVTVHDKHQAASEQVFMLGAVGLSHNYGFKNLERQATQSRTEKAGFVWIKLSQTYDAELNYISHVSVPEVSWFEQFKQYAADAETADAIYPLVSGVADLFADSEYAEVDAILIDPSIESFSTTALVTMVRTTYPARGKLANWSGCVQRISTILQARGCDSAKLLRGLY